MSKLAQHLRRHLSGEVLASAQALHYFSTDGSIFKLLPRAIVYPHDVADISKVARFCSQLSEQGTHLAITARGKGTDQAGGAIGSGVVLAMPAHMHRLVGFNKTDVTVQPGMMYGDLQRTLHSHGRFLPPYPSSIEFSTIGGAVANNACGEKTLKYGCTRDYVKSLEVVLANGQMITAEKLTKRQLSLKKGQTDFEGEIYRKLDGLLQDNMDLIQKARPRVSKNAAGYALWEVIGKDGSFDLSKLFVGSQGTLGIVSEVTLATEAYNPHTQLLAAFFDDVGKAGEAVLRLEELKPSCMEVVDRNLLDFIRRTHPAQLAGIVEDNLPAIVLLIEFDDDKSKVRERKAKKAIKAIEALATSIKATTKPHEQASLWKIRRSAAAIIWQDQGSKKALPIIEDGAVPVEKLPEFLLRVHSLFKRHNIETAIWGHAGDGHFHMQPFLDLGNTGDRQTVFRLMDEFYSMVIDMGGTTSGEHSDGRLRAPYLRDLYGAEMYQLFREVKRIFDPLNILNTGVKIGVRKEDLRMLVRDEYSMPHLYDHMPRLS